MSTPFDLATLARSVAGGLIAVDPKLIDAPAFLAGKALRLAKELDDQIHSVLGYDESAHMRSIITERGRQLADLRRILGERDVEIERLNGLLSARGNR